MAKERFARPQKEPSLLKAITAIRAIKYGGSHKNYDELPRDGTLFYPMVAKKEVDPSSAPVKTSDAGPAI